MGDLLDEINVLARRARMRSVRDDPTAEWLESRLVKGTRINVFVPPDQAERFREVFRKEQLVTVCPCKHLPGDGRAFFVEAPPTLEEVLRIPLQQEGLEG